MFGLLRKRGAKASSILTVTTSADLLRRMQQDNQIAGVSVTPVRAMQHATVYACIQVRGESFAQLSGKVFRRLPGGEREEAPDHWASKLWREKPGKDWDPFSYQERISNDLDLRGNHYAYKVAKSNGDVTELVPLPVDDVKVERDKATRQLRYTVEDFRVRGKSTFTRADIFHARRMSRDGLTGLSPIEQCKYTMAGLLAAETYGLTTFQNGAAPSGVLDVPEELQDDEMAALQQQLDENWSGNKANRTMILTGGKKFTPIEISNRDAQFLETRQFGRTEICGIYRVPPHMIADLSRSTNNNIEHQGIEWVVYGLLPGVRRVESTWNCVEMGGGGEYYLEFGIDGLVRGDFETRMKGYQLAIQMGIMTPNEVRRKENLPAMNEGNRLMMMVNVQSLEKAVQSIDTQAPADETTVTTEGDDDAEPDEGSDE